jgi:hypothetical protein
MPNQIQPPALNKHIPVYFPADMAKAVAERAAADMISASAWIRQAVRDRLQTEFQT